MQLFDKDGAALALDLFGELKANAERAATDTFIVNLILSDQGQTLMARTRNLPLAADEVVALRAELGLPK